jgi:hypothetical protein
VNSSLRKAYTVDYGKFKTLMRANARRNHEKST